MLEYDWRGLLESWKRDILTSHFAEFEEEVPPTLWSTGEIGGPGAPEEQLTAMERRLGVALPPSYRQFLATMNGGWLLTWSPQPYHFWSSEEVEWFAAREGRWLEIWLDKPGIADKSNHWIPDEEYFNYENGIAWGIRDVYRRSCLAVSNPGDDSTIYLLNPQTVTPEGEWEAWSIDIDSERRFPSFWEMLRQEYQTYLASRNDFERISS